MPTVIKYSEYIEINSVPLATPAFWVKDPTPLWDAAGVRGSDRLIPGIAGQAPLPRIGDVVRVPLKLIVSGAADQNGTLATAANRRSQLLTNWEYLRTNIFTPNPTAPGTWNLIYHRPDATTKSGGCFVGTGGSPQPTVLATGAPALEAILDILLPAGVLT
jgi:hypothetical protein